MSQKKTISMYRWMNLYQCKVRVIEVRESIMLVEAPNKLIARDPAWVEVAAEESLCDNFETTKETFKVVECELVTDLAQLPPDWRDTLPWHHPQHIPDREILISDRRRWKRRRRLPQKPKTP